MEKLFTILLVNYKTEVLTSLCLKRIALHFSLDQIDIVVVDNDSNDASLVYLKDLDWITLVERKCPLIERAYEAHGRALDLGITFVKTPYVLTIHSDTLINSKAILDVLFSKHDSLTAAVGCIHQIHRSYLHRHWRTFRRYFKHKLAALFSPVVSRRNEDTYLKSYCTLWNASLIKQSQVSFCADGRNPGFSLQDDLESKGLKLTRVPSSNLFRYIEHIQAGTVAENGGFEKGHRRLIAYHDFLDRQKDGAVLPELSD